MSNKADFSLYTLLVLNYFYSEMCFTLSLQVEKHRLEKALNARFGNDYQFEPFYFVSAFEYPTIPVLSSKKTGFFTPMSWGLIPHWVKSQLDSQAIKSKTLNARVESIFEKPSFRYSAKTNRCVIPATGFFEWQDTGGRKIPWFIAPKDEEIMQLAGIYSTWTNPETGEIIDTFSIITVPANPLLEKIHNTKKRMPAILKPEMAKVWLDASLNTENYAKILNPIGQEHLKAYTVSPLVSNSKTNRNVPEALIPYTYPEQQPLF